MNKEYKFNGYRNFHMFCQVNIDKLFLPEDSQDLIAIKQKVSQFVNAVTNTTGGCPCNKKKRREMAKTMFMDAARVIAGNNLLQRRIGALLNGAESVLFFGGDEMGNPNTGDKVPFVKVDTKLVGPPFSKPTAHPNPRAPRSTITPTGTPTETTNTATFGRRPPTPPSK